MEKLERLEKRVLELEALLAAALARIVDLEGQLKQNSGNSSRPPSSDMRRRKVPKETTGRKPGGQPGHPGTMREPVPSDQVAEIVDRDPETCANCGSSLEDAPRLDADLRQIMEAPEFQAFVREFRLWKKRCPKCGGLSRGKMPAGSPKGAFGPRIQAMVAMLSGRFRLSRREGLASAAMTGCGCGLRPLASRRFSASCRDGAATRRGTCSERTSLESSTGTDGNHTSNWSALEAKSAMHTFDGIFRPCWKAAVKRQPRAPC